MLRSTIRLILIYLGIIIIDLDRTREENRFNFIAKFYHCLLSLNK